MNVMQWVTRFRANSSQVTLPLERKNVFPIRWKNTTRQCTRLSTRIFQFFVEQRKWYIKPCSVVKSWYACLCHHCFSNVKTKTVLIIVWPRAWVQVKYNMVDPAPPPLERVNPRLYVRHILITQTITVKGVDRQNVQTGTLWVFRVVARRPQCTKHFGVLVGRRTITVRIDVHAEAVQAARGCVETVRHLTTDIGRPFSRPRTPVEVNFDVENVSPTTSFFGRFISRLVANEGQHEKDHRHNEDDHKTVATFKLHRITPSMLPLCRTTQYCCRNYSTNTLRSHFQFYTVWIHSLLSLASPITTTKNL